MPDNQQVAATKSKRRFIKFVKPVLEKELDMQVFPAELENNVLLKTLDIYAGMDYVVSSNNGLRGLSSRVQNDNQFKEKYKTFTIREVRESGARTELEKLVTARSNNLICPYWILQAYTSGDEKLNRFAVAKWDDILTLIAERISYQQITGKDQIGQARFQVVNWYDLIRLGLYIYIYPPIKSIAYNNINDDNKICYEQPKILQLPLF